MVFNDNVFVSKSCITLCYPFVYALKLSLEGRKNMSRTVNLVLICGFPQNVSYENPLTTSFGVQLGPDVQSPICNL